LSYKLNDMDAKITLSFDNQIIEQSKKFAEDNNISLSRLTEFLLGKVTSKNYRSLDDMPVSDWVSMLSEGDVSYVRLTSNRNKLKNEFYESRKEEPNWLSMVSESDEADAVYERLPPNRKKIRAALHENKKKK
jgi:hypothetical protein